MPIPGEMVRMPQAEPAPNGVERSPAASCAEASTAAELARAALEGIRSRHDLRLPGRIDNLDHVAVGSCGVLLIESKAMRGVANLETECLRLTHMGEPVRVIHPLGPRLRAIAAELADRITEATGLYVDVRPVVALWMPFASQVDYADGVTYLHGSWLASWLRAQPPILSGDRIDEIDAFLATLEGPR